MLANRLRFLPGRGPFRGYPSLVCIHAFQSPALRKHAGVGLVPVANVADWLPLSLVNPGPADDSAGPFLHGGVIDGLILVHGFLSPFAPHGTGGCPLRLTEIARQQKTANSWKAAKSG